jgi:hypothetical protein
MPDDSLKKKPPGGDDRNLVVVDDDFKNADAEDRLWLFWERNKTALVRGTTAVVLAVLGLLLYEFVWKAGRREALHQDYNACLDEPARRAFAAKHAGEPLAVVALTEVADDLKAAAKFAEAAKAFDEAARLAGLAGETPVVKALGARARLEAALARVDGGDATGETALTTLANDETVAETWRGYAMLTLANLAVAKGDLPAATKWLNLMDKRLRKDHVWREYKDSLIRSEPGLLNPVAAPAALPTGK